MFGIDRVKHREFVESPETQRVESTKGHETSTKRRTKLGNKTHKHETSTKTHNMTNETMLVTKEEGMENRNIRRTPNTKREKKM